MGILRDLNIVSGKDVKAAEVFENLYSDFRTIQYNKPSEYIDKLWNRYQKLENRNNNQNGRVFEYIINTLLYREGILPFYTNAKIAFVPDTYFDIVLYNAVTNAPVVLSIKTSLRERYKQADHESLLMKDVYKGAKSYLITLDKDVARYQKKKKLGHIRTINGIFHGISNDFDNLIATLKTMEFIEAPLVKIVTSNFMIK